jgi:hypothetical protein
LVAERCDAAIRPESGREAEGLALETTMKPQTRRGGPVLYPFSGDPSLAGDAGARNRLDLPGGHPPRSYAVARQIVSKMPGDNRIGRGDQRLGGKRTIDERADHRPLRHN